MAGAIIKIAADADMIVYDGQYSVSFECIIANGQNYGILGTSSCIVRNDPAKGEV